MSIVHNHSLSNEDQKFEIQLNCCKLEQTESVKLLGIECDEQLSFDAYMDCLCGSYQSVLAYLIELRLICQDLSVYCIKIH